MIQKADTLSKPLTPSELTQKRLLDAAEILFAERGYNATHVREITKVAGANIAAVNYHFGGKQALYERMFERLLKRLRSKREQAMVEVMSRPDVNLTAVLRTYAEVFLDLHTGDEEQSKRQLLLFMREMTEPHLPPDTMFAKMIGPTKQMLHEAFQRTCPGLDDVSIELCAHSLVGQLLHILDARTLYTHADVTDAPILDADLAVEHTIRYSVAAMEALAKGGNS